MSSILNVIGFRCQITHWLYSWSDSAIYHFLKKTLCSTQLCNECITKYLFSPPLLSKSVPHARITITNKHNLVIPLVCNPFVLRCDFVIYSLAITNTDCSYESGVIRKVGYHLAKKLHHVMSQPDPHENQDQCHMAGGEIPLFPSPLFLLPHNRLVWLWVWSTLLLSSAQN